MKVNTTDEECAVVCMIVSNPGQGERPHAWQKRVNDLIRALRDERNGYRDDIKLLQDIIDAKKADEDRRRKDRTRRG